MINRKDIDAYLNIKAPDSIKERLQSQINEDDRRNSKLSLSFYALAASLIIVAAAILFIPISHAELYFEGNEIKGEVTVSNYSARAARTIDASVDMTLEIPLEVKVTGKSKVSVSTGEIKLSDSEDGKKTVSVKGRESIIWVLPLDALTENATFTVEKGGKKLIYSISQDNETGKTVLRKVQ